MFVLAQPMRFRAMRRLPIAFGWLTKRGSRREISDPTAARAYGRAASGATSAS